MSESSSTALLENIDPEVLEAWIPHLKAAKGQDERSAIYAAAKLGARPGEKNVEELTQEDVDKRFDEIVTAEEKERRRTKVEQDVDKFVISLKDHKMLEGASHPKYEINGKKHEKEKLREKKDWSEFGWGDTEKKQVEEKLATVLGWQKGDKRVNNAIDLLVASGQTAQDVLTGLQNPPDLTLTAEDRQRIRENPRLTPHDVVASKKLTLFTELNLDEKSVQRFVLQEEFAVDLENEYQDDPKNIEDIAWQVMHHYHHDLWGPGGKFPLLEMRIAKDANGNVDPEKSKYYVSQKHFVRWARERMWNLWDINNDVGDFVSAIELPKRYSKMTFGQMFPEHTKYFASEDGETTYSLMAQELIVESFGMGTMNQMASSYKQEMRDPKGLQEAIGKMFAGNVFTKETFRKNLLELMTIMPLNYEGNKPGELLENDGIFGASMMEMFLAYYNLSDFDELQKLIGKGSSFFTKQGYMQALQSVVLDKTTESSGEANPTVLNAATQEALNNAFDENGEITKQSHKDNFIDLINFFGSKINNPDAEYTTRRLLYRVIAEKYGRVVKKENGEVQTDTVFVDGEKREVVRYGLTSDDEGKNEDTWTQRMAWVGASAMARVFGAAARNDTTAQGYDAMSKMHLFETYRNKMMNKNADEHGNPYTIHQFKVLAMDPFNAMTTESWEYVKDEQGKIKTDEKGKPLTRQKPVMEVLREMQATMSTYTARLRQMELAYENEKDETKKAEKLKELDEFRTQKNRRYLNKAGELTFNARAMSNYYDDHLMRAHETYKLLLGAEEVEMEKYVTYDAWGGVSFNREKFQEDVQHKVMHPIRYFLSTYPDVKYNQKFRMLDQAESWHQHKPVYREMTLGEAMFGHEMLNREQFWLRDKKGKPIEMRDKNGRKMKGLYEIDYDKVEGNKIQVWKQFFMTKIGADLHAHRAFHSSDNRFDINYYNNVLKAIESIGKEVEGDEFSIRDQTRGGNFFDKKDMKWFRKSIKVENYDLFLRAIFRDLLMPDEKQEGIGLLLFFSLAAREIVRREG